MLSSNIIVEILIKEVKYTIINLTLEVLPFFTNLSGDDNRFLCFGLPPSSDDDSEPLDSDDSEEPELDSSLLDEEEEV